MDNLFTMPEKVALWDLLESRRITVGPVGFKVADGFSATAWIDAGDDTIDTYEATGSTAKEAVENLLRKMEEGTNENQRGCAASA
jgi:hypothetical protein